jgi:type IV pilus assembly protein PilQ
VAGLVSSHLENTPLEVGLRALLEANGFTVEKLHNIYHISQMTGRKTFSINVDQEGLFSVDLKSAELDEVIRAISLQGNIDIVTSGYVRGKINAHITNMPLEKLLRLILEGTNFTFAKVEEIYVVGEGISLSPTSLTFINSDLIKINWLDVEDALKILPDAFPRANIRVLKDQNAFAVVGTSQLIDKLKAFLSKIDMPAPQIMIEVLVVDFTSSWKEDLGMEEARGDKDYLSSSLFPAGGGVVPLPLTYSKKKYDEFFSLRLRALVRQGKAKVRANPRIATLNGHEASIDVLTKYRYREIIETYKEGNKSFQPAGVPREIETGIKVKIRPWVTASNEINVEITPEISNKTEEQTETGAAGGALPVTSDRRIKTSVRVKDGETIIIGGLIQSQRGESIAQVPLLGRIPFLGWLFKQKKVEEIQTELVIYITPHLLPAK